MRASILSVLALLILGACAYALDDHIQDIAFSTPGAKGAVCDVFIDKVNYVVKPPQTINVIKSREDMFVDCKAPGNRRQQQYIEPGYSKDGKWNVLNAGAGLPLDYASNSLYRYPDRVEINFAHMPVTAYPQPDYMDPALQQVEDTKLEEFLPGRPRMNSDADRVNLPLERRKAEGGDVPLTDDTSGFSEPAVKGPDKGDLQSVIRNLSPKSGSGTKSSGTQSPVPLFPGQ